MAAHASGDLTVTAAPHWLSATEIARAYADRTLSPTELMRTLLKRIEHLQPKLHAFIRLDGEAAMDAARNAEQELASGRTRGPLHGIPIGIKDIIDVAGLPTTAHSKILVGNVARQDAVCVAKVRAAGAIVMGKLSTHEFAVGGPSFDLPFPPARNPWNPRHHPGGSSSGSGAGVASGMFPLALGTDTGGSVRNPASVCGIVGLKPTYGLVSRRGVFPLAFTLDHVGPMTRTVADNALLLEALAGHDPADPGSAQTNARHFARHLDGGVAGLRIGFIRHFHEMDIPAHPDVTAALEDVERILQAEGALVETVTLPKLGEFAAINRVILCSEAWSIHAKWLRERPQDYGALARRRLLPGAFMTAGDYVGAQRRRAELIAAVNDKLRDYDVLMCASSMDPASEIEDAAETARTYPRQARAPFNVTGHPALAMMSGLSGNGMPVSVQFVGRYFEDATVLRVAAAYEKAAGWHKKHPPI
jgi:aspartyl-tRNA(Asn)/glutamyl-tRNA(Gln) amidotransferase subunit A